MVKDKKSILNFCPCTKVHEGVYAAVRIIIGLLFAFAGLMKFSSGMATAGFMGLPPWLAFVVALLEVVTGILIAAGAFTYLATIPAAIIMLVAVIMLVSMNGVGDIMDNAHKPLLYLFAFLLIHVKGSGKFSLDALMSKK